MQYFTVQARSDREALEKMKASYGEEARILTHRTVRLGGVRGLFGLEGVELTGYLSEDGAKRRRSPDPEEEKKKILESVRREQTLQVLLKEIQGLRESLQARGGLPEAERTHPTVERIDELLRLQRGRLPQVRPPSLLTRENRFRPSRRGVVDVHNREPPAAGPVHRKQSRSAVPQRGNDLLTRERQL